MALVIESKPQFANILKASEIVVADFHADWCEPCKQIAPLYESLAKSLSRKDVVTFVKIDTDRNRPIAEEYQIASLPTFILFRDGKVMQTVKGANPLELQGMIEKLGSEMDSVGDSSGSGNGGRLWSGAEIPRGYSDLTDQVEIRGSELLNADEDAGPVRILFENSRPAALNKEKEKSSASSSSSSSKDFVQSGSDDQLLLYVPFQGSVKLHTLQITSLPEEGQEDVSRPEVIHLYINRPQNMDFGEADETEPTQAITLSPEDWNAQGTANISLRFVKFQKTTTLIIYVQKGADDSEAVRIDRIRLIGEAGTKREMGKLQKVVDDE